MAPPSGRVPHGVVDQVHDRLGDPVGIGHDGQRPIALDGDLSVGTDDARGSADVVDQHAEVHLARLEAAAAGLQLGEQEEVGRQAREPIDLAAHRGQGCCRNAGPTLAARQDVDVAAQDGQRRSELVGRVGGERPLRAEGRVDPIGHVVEGPSEPTDLVVASGKGGPRAHIAGCDPVRGAGDALEGPQPVPSHQPDRDAGDEEQDDRGGLQGRSNVGQRAVDAVQGDRQLRDGVCRSGRRDCRTLARLLVAESAALTLTRRSRGGPVVRSWTGAATTSVRPASPGRTARIVEPVAMTLA